MRLINRTRWKSLAERDGAPAVPRPRRSPSAPAARPRIRAKPTSAGGAARVQPSETPEGAPGGALYRCPCRRSDQDPECRSLPFAALQSAPDPPGARIGTGGSGWLGDSALGGAIFQARGSGRAAPRAPGPPPAVRRVARRRPLPVVAASPVLAPPASQSHSTAVRQTGAATLVVPSLLPAGNHRPLRFVSLSPLPTTPRTGNGPEEKGRKVTPPASPSLSPPPSRARFNRGAPDPGIWTLAQHPITVGARLG